MQMPALLVAILLAGGNPVWDQQKPQQMTVCESTVTTVRPGLVTPAQKTRRAPVCRTTAKPIAEAVTPAPIQIR